MRLFLLLVGEKKVVLIVIISLVGMQESLAQMMTTMLTAPLGGIFAPPTSVAAAANDGKTSSTIALQWRAGLQRSAPLSHQGWIDLRMRLELP